MLGEMNLRRKDIALIVSISLNVFLIGAGVTVYALHETGAPTPGGQRAPMRAASSGLDKAHRAAFMQLLQGQGKTIQAETRSARAIRDDAWASLAVRNFDPAVTKRRLAQARELNVLAHSTLEDAVVDFAAGLTPAQRVVFSQALRHAALHQRTESAKDRPNAP
jgi:uncharacterized membrane protein